MYLPSWDEWIEMFITIYKNHVILVSPFVGWVDWNIPPYYNVWFLGVSPFAGCVDWNRQKTDISITNNVSPFTGWVDWNEETHIRVILEHICHCVSPFMGWVDWNYKKYQNTQLKQSVVLLRFVFACKNLKTDPIL